MDKSSPAFPFAENYPRDLTFQMGLTKREYAAIAIMAGLMAYPGSSATAESFAPSAVSAADALLAELAK